ncbi:helix-turn-helix domain-containing protein [Paenibacillus eucommiae]|uniref:YesN/AraC family two-component response regulator n=1 Tax=Paenibacillus eucommiae TaxID=1355755 RepID=A0ABS4IPN9_9BACL|nr:AraC family transcriptional regulator [Paenibacillus eucommiae]MBP1989480.1 YesN/AraC family two-component response regulator [Paenibacillus eucommiae]
MEFFNEKIDYENPFLSIKIFHAWRKHDHMTTWHYHKELEMLLVLEGELDVYIEDELLHLMPEDVVLIGSSELHRDRSWEDKELKYIVFQFDLEHYFDQNIIPYLRYFADPALSLSKLNYILLENAAARIEVVRCVKTIFAEWTAKEEGYEIAISILIKQILLTLLRNDSRHVLSSKDHADYIRLKPVFEYIEQNLHTRVGVEEASKAVNISYYYFVKYFKKVLGISFMDYVNFKKIKKAEKILLTQNISVAEVGEAVGMPNMAHFYKTFKKFNHCSPHVFRKKMLDWVH